MNLSGSVGRGGINLAWDVLRIQKALNVVRDQEGLTEIAEDGVIGPQTVGAIQDFQRAHTQVSDARIDPHGVTLRELQKIVAPIVAPRVRSAILAILTGLEAELEARGLELSSDVQDGVDRIEHLAMLLPGGTEPLYKPDNVDYPDRPRPRFQLAFAPAIPIAAAALVEALLMAILAMIAIMIIIQLAPAMGRALEDLVRQIQILMAKLIDEVKEAVREVEELIKRNTKAGMRCSAELIAFRQVSQELLDLLAAPRSPDELGKKRFEKHVLELFEKWQKALQALLDCLKANGVTLT